MKKPLRFLVKLLPLLILGYFFKWVTLFFVVCGIYDVARNRALDFSKVNQYFFGNGILTWLLSPFNVLMDILSLPYWNKGIYKIEDLPKPYQEEIRRLIEAAHREDLVGKLEERIKNNSRSMIFFKWYGANLPSVVDVPAFQEKYRYIRTIGVSVFNKKQSTSRHFGPLRATLRVLYNVNDMDDNSAYIEVGDVKNYWRENKLFIFDDTLMHQSFNESDKARYCLFVDILRPTIFPALMTSIVNVIRFFLKSVNYVFYKNWEVIKN
jgi:aspartyl/asparaginyl beta-hydroxylase (cupin superfamily)